MARGLLLVLLLAVCALHIEATSVTCAKKYNEKVTIKDGDSFTYMTQAGTNYESKSKCKITYKKHKSCSAMKFSCSDFSIHSPKTSCKGGDKMVVSTKEAKNVKYCQTSGPDVTTIGRIMKVIFTSNGKKEDTGAVCTVECVPDEVTTPSPTTAPGPGDCKCGLANRATKIVGGQETEVSEYPWQVGVVYKSDTFVWCGATVISTQWILTAAHCTVGKGAEDIQVLLGEHDYSTTSETAIVRMDIVEIIEHESYDSQTVDYDFSLLKMETAINFNDYSHIRPICLPTDNSEDYDGFIATVTGWGTTTMGGSTSEQLREVEVEVLSNNECKNDYGYGSWQITARMLCAHKEGGNDGDGNDACQGDSGGPLVTAGNGDGVTAGQNYELIGVVSWGNGCALEGFPGINSRVTDQLSWITSKAAVSGNTCPRT